MSLLLQFFYHTAAGRLILRPLCSRPVSRAAGALLDTGASRILIRPFVRANHIDLSEYDMRHIRSFNDFFCRKIRTGRRPVDRQSEHLTAPCDGLLSIWPIRDGTVIPVKQSRFSVRRLLGEEERKPEAGTRIRAAAHAGMPDSAGRPEKKRSGTDARSLAEEFDGGLCLVFRLCVHHYHRYVYVDSGIKEKDVFLPGCLHTVRPVALETVPVFTENCRSYTVIHSETFGKMIQMEVGALLVGRICNHHPEARQQVFRGEEKGMFQYGGSTIIVLLKKGSAVLDERFAKAGPGGEIPVKLGEKIGVCSRSLSTSGRQN